MNPNKTIFYLQAHYSGNVQGVGFRLYTSEIAQKFPVKGFVQNLNDGRVLLEVEGEEAEVLAFQTELERQLSRFIQGKEVSTLERQATFTDFSIRPTKRP